MYGTISSHSPISTQVRGGSPVASSGALLREARLRAGLTQDGLGRRTGKDGAQIARWERDDVSPPFETLRSMVRACGFDLPAELVPFDPGPEVQVQVTLALSPQERLG